MKKIDYCYLVISCKKNTSLADYMVQKIIESTEYNTNIYVSFDYDCNRQKSGRITYINGKSNINFGKRIQNALETIPFKFVIVMCDDFIVEEQINEKEIDNLIESLYNHKNISSIALAQVSGKYENTELNKLKFGENYKLRNHYGSYKTTLQCSLWNKNAFYNLMNNINSPWEFEIFSNIKTYIYSNKFYALTDDLYQPIKYNRGKFILRGKVYISEKERLEKKFGEKINLDDFETTNEDRQNDKGLFKKIKRKILIIIYEIFYRFLSIFIKKDLNIKIS